LNFVAVFLCVYFWQKPSTLPRGLETALACKDKSFGLLQRGDEFQLSKPCLLIELKQTPNRKEEKRAKRKTN
jgi:hypothetical protein